MTQSQEELREKITNILLDDKYWNPFKEGMKWPIRDTIDQQNLNKTLLKDFESLITTEVTAALTEVENKIANLYMEFENNKPPKDFVTSYESEFNNGFYAGKLSAIERITLEITGKDGDHLLKATLERGK